MRKIVKRPDGTVIEYEGTAEELAELEYTEDTVSDKKNENANKGKRLLTEQKVLSMIEEAICKREVNRCHHNNHFNPWQSIPYVQLVEPVYQPNVWYSSNKAEIDVNLLSTTLTTLPSKEDKNV